MALVKVHFIKEYCKYLGLTFLFGVSLIFILDLAEVLRSGAKDIVLTTACKTGKNIVQLIPLIVLIGTIMTFSNLSKKNELVIFSTLGLSNSFFLMIMTAILSLVFVLIVVILIPITAKLSLINEMGDNKMVVGEDGILFKGSRNSFVRAEMLEGSRFSKITIWVMDEDFRLQEVVIGETGQINGKQLVVENPTIHSKLSQEIGKEFLLQVDISPDDIRKNILKPDQVSLFEIPSFIKILKRLGVSISQYDRYLWDKATIFINLFTMGLLGLTCSFSLVSRLAKKERIFYGIVAGLGIFFSQDFIITILPYETVCSVLLAKGLLFGLVASHYRLSRV